MSRRKPNAASAGVNADLAIIGGGAAGLMAAATAAERNLRCIVLERNNRPGRKLLMCGNNRCNLTTDLLRDELISRYTPHNRDFLRPALTAFDAKTLRRWFNEQGLQTVVKESGRVYPKTERASDVANCFKDLLRKGNVPLVLNCAVSEIRQAGGIFQVESATATFFAKQVLVATGGVSYPKTGSVGDGQNFAKSFGHKLIPYRPGLVAYELNDGWLRQVRDLTLTNVGLTVRSAGRDYRFQGGLEVRKGLVHGPAMIDASNVMSREDLTDVSIAVDLLPDLDEADFVNQLNSGVDVKSLLTPYLPKESVGAILTNLLGRAALPVEVARAFKQMPLPVKGPRPLKEAMVTVGGIDLTEVDSQTMQSTREPGLYFAGEALDVEGPCGGFNLQAAFATARLAVNAMADTQPKRNYWE